MRGAQAGQLLLEVRNLILQCFHFERDLLERGFQCRGRLFEHLEAPGDQVIRAAAGHRFDAPDPRCRRPLADNQERADIRRPVEVGAAAQLIGILRQFLHHRRRMYDGFQIVCC